MMYFPTACKDGEYFFDYLDAEWLSPDEILGGYKDWRRIEEHPLSSRVDKQIRHEATNRQQNPLEKTGVVGAFCSAFSIHEAIETFLPDVYESCGYDRYTYLRGSTSGGAKVYDDLFLYSHHESDPTCRSLCNAFDLVRIHKFGEKDANVRDKTDITKRPSFIAMCDFAKEHKEVLRIVLDEKKRDAKNDFKGIADDEPTPDWVLEFDKNKKDEPLANEKNIRLILQNDPKLKGLFAANYFTKQVTLTRAAWKRDPANMEMSNTDWSNLHAYFGEKYGIRKRKLVEDGWRIETCNNATHPVREYLNSLQWDGVSRIDNLFIDYLGVLDSEDGYERKVSRMLLASAVSRIYNPGCKMDYITVFVGEQGLGKSSLISRLAKNADWYAALNFSEGKETLENLRGKWLVELEELAGVGKSSPEKIKSFVSRQADRYRAAYEVSSQDYKRECVFFGTTNNPHFLKGEGGDRRFHPLSGSKERRKKIWVELEDWEVDQIWAEAKVIYENGEIPKLILETEKLGESRQKDHREIDDLEESIDVFLAQPLKADWAKDPSSDFIFAVEGESKTVLRDKVTIQAIAQHLRRHEGVHGGVANKALTDRIRKIMNNKTDWKSQTIRYGAEGLVMRGWKKTQNE